MLKSAQLKELQKRLPDQLILEDETSYDFTEDEYLGMLCWIKYFNIHYKEKEKTELPPIIFPLISKRLRLDFGLYIVPNKITELNRGKHIIYISENGKGLDGKVQKQTLKQMINTWNL
jgi:hypothetical protein